MPAKKTAQDYFDLAAQRSLSFIGDLPENVEGKALWRCAAGHEFGRNYRYISRGYGCPYCAGKMPRVEADYRAAAAKIGITFLGPTPKNTRTKTLWRCQDGHEFMAPYDSVLRGHSCPHHQVNAPKTEADYHALAQTRGFSLVGVVPKYTNQKTTWQCANGHRFDSRYNNIDQGQSCPYCIGHYQKTEVDYLVLAQARNFVLVGDIPDTVSIKTTWRCSQGHEFLAHYNRIQQGGGCPHCAGSFPKSIDDYHALAKQIGIEFIGTFPKNTDTNTLWRCSCGNQWECTHYLVKIGTLCPACSESKGERVVALTLDKLGLVYEREKRFDGCKDKRKLAFDFFLPSLGTLIEYHGGQHYAPVEWFGGEDNFKQAQRRDAIKVEWAKTNGYTLIVIPYTVEDIEAHLKEYLT